MGADNGKATKGEGQGRGDSQQCDRRSGATALQFLTNC